MSGADVRQGDIRWVDLGDPLGSEPGYRRPVVVVQGDAFNASSLATVVCVALTTNLKWARAPGNVLLPATITGLPKDSVANVSQIATIDKSLLEDPVSKLKPAEIKAILRGLDLMMGR